MASVVCSLLRHDEIQGNITCLFHKILEDKTTHLLVPQIFHKILLDTVSQKVIADVMGETCIHKQFWKNSNIRPGGEDFSYAFVPNSLIEESFKLASKQSAKYIDEKMIHLFGIADPLDLLTYCIDQTSIDGLFLEFGVFSGYTINHISSKTEKTVHGFDTFEGIPEQWNSVPEGTFSTNGQVPEVNENVQLHVGLFDKTLPKFRDKFCEDISFLHIDSDLYSSAHTVLFTLKNQIKKGTIIVFDEYFNYPGWKKHEFRAFSEFIEETGKQYEYIAYAGKGFSVGVKIL